MKRKEYMRAYDSERSEKKRIEYLARRDEILARNREYYFANKERIKTKRRQRDMMSRAELRAIRKSHA